VSCFLLAVQENQQAADTLADRVRPVAGIPANADAASFIPSS